MFARQTHADICDNLVPIEIALRCARAVIEGQPFAAYIIIPMWPEGGALPSQDVVSVALRVSRSCLAHTIDAWICLMQAFVGRWSSVMRV